ncbi:MAG: rRNA maturation RNase YbeY [Erysipelotrichaceae bacterium]|nr:rRNA maturation RNase YbeY [Erysipelotrichaceae bacterium]
MALNVYNQTDYRGYLKYKEYFREILNNAREVLDLPKRVAVSVIFVNDEQIHQINRDYRNIDRPTDVISFALADNKDEIDYIPEELGDIFINIDAARRQAVDYQHSEKREICFLFTHGLLHLNGFDHQTKEEEQEMIRYQKLILDKLVGQDD